MVRTHFIALVFLAFALVARAAEVRWEPAGGTLGVGQTSSIELVFEECEPAAAITLPQVPDVSFGRPSQSSQTSIVNFKMSRRTVLSYPVLPIRKGRITIPSFEVETDEGKMQVKAVSFEIGDATVGRSNLSIESIAGSQLTTDASAVWAGQVFGLKYDLLIVRRFNPTGVADLEWTAPPGLVTEQWAEPQNISAVVENEPRVGVEYRTRAYARDSGTLTIPSATQMINLEVGSSAFGMFQRPNIEQYLITSPSTTLSVRPLPTPAPADFMKAVGEFTLTSTVVPQAAAVGEPVTWTLKLEGTGNWPENLALPSREVSKDFQLIRPQVNRTTKEGTLFEGSVTEDVVLVPTKPGTYTLGPVSYSFFNPKDGRYETIKTNTVTVIVRPAVASAATQAPDAGVFSFTPDDPVQKTPAPTQPGRLPLDPIKGTATAMLPSAGVPVGWLVLPAIPLLLSWLAFAMHRARMTDPLRPQREAHARMDSVLAAVKNAGTPAQTATALRAWQNTAIDIFGRKRAAPSPSEFMFAASQFLTPSAAEYWRTLWVEAEAAIYSHSVGLPADWVARASTASRALRLPGFKPASALQPANLWPATVLAILFALPPDLDAADPADAYASGDFATAERAWREQVAAEPLNWKAHNNLGLALAQQDRWSEAAGHWAAAFAQNPSDHATRFQFELGVARAEFTSPELSKFAESRGATWLARFASPAQWQALLGVASLLAAGAGALYLWDRYDGRRRWRFFTSASLLATGVAAAATSTGALHTWGPLVDPNIALVWTPTDFRSIPTEAGEQQTQPLGAGTLARIEHRFLGWVQLSFPDGQTGWVRRETVVPLYR
jgi:tetratricopeptide (TPR) repeat protein